MGTAQRTIGVLGHAGHGKSTLTSAIMKGTQRYTLVDFRGHADDGLDGAIVVVAATDGPAPELKEELPPAKQLAIVVALNKADLVEDDEILDLVELEVRELLNENGFSGDTLPVVRVSALGALEGDAKWVDAITALLAALDNAIGQT